MHSNDLRTLRSELRAPGAERRSLPFWGWNERMEPEELRRQLRGLRHNGIGGFFIHSREGLETPYLSDDWLEAVRLSSEEAARLGLETWIYDEDKWPSGAAGGMVAARDPERFTAKGLTLEVTAWTEAEPELAPGDRLIGVYRVRLEGSRIVTFGEGDTRLVLRMERSRSSEWYSGSAPSDDLSADAVREFIRLTHERYDRLFEGRLSDHVKGFFTDEPNFYDFFAAFTPGRPWLPWTADLPDELRARRGRDMLPELPLLFYTGEGCERTRHDFWRTLTELFSERYMRPIYEWCDAHGVLSSGHMLYENDMGYGIRVCGAPMPHYRWLHAPAVDLLGDQRREYLTVKQCTSVAEQYGREATVTETYGCTGWEFDLEGQKRLGDWQLVQGITRRCMHLAEYSITGCRKRDYPPVFNYQNTWWPYARVMEDYFARLSACTSCGEVVRDILVLHPISSLWTQCGSAPDEDLSRLEMNMGWKDVQFTALNERGEEYDRLAELLLRAHLDFDFGDETILSELGATEGGRLTVGRGRYSLIIVPEVTSLFASTIRLLERYLEPGGSLIWVGEAPAMVEGMPSEAGRRLYARPEVLHVPDYEALPALIYRLRPDGLRLTAREGGAAREVLTMLRRTEDGLVLVCVNQAESRSTAFRAELPMNGAVTAYDPLTDTEQALRCRSDGRRTAFIDELPPSGSRVYLLTRDETLRTERLSYPYRHPHRTLRLLAALGPEAPFERTEPNVLTLDRCRYSLDGSPLSECMEIWQAQRRMRETLGWQQVYYNGAPQRFTWLEAAAQLPAVPFRMELEVEVRELPRGSCRLAVEKPEGLSLSCNGSPCRLTEEWYVDRGIRCFELPTLRPGTNTLALSGLYTADRELEDVYLLGDFGVSTDRALIAEPDTLHMGDWCLQGYLHYAGDMVYHFRAPGFDGHGRVRLQLGAYRASLAEITVNGSPAGICFGRCVTEADITSLLRPEENAISIRVVGSRRNLFGPFHRAYATCSRISWADFRTEGADYCEGYSVEPYGLMGQIALYREDG